MILELLRLKVPAWALLASLAAGSAASGLLVHTLDKASYNALVAKVAERDRKAGEAARHVEHTQAVVVHTHDTAEVKAQAKLSAHTLHLTQEISHVLPPPLAAACVPWGLVRLHDAAALGVEPAAVVAPAGVPDNACSPFAWHDFASVIVQNYGAARQNAEQLDALIQFERERVAAFNGQPSAEIGAGRLKFLLEQGQSAPGDLDAVTDPIGVVGPAVEEVPY